MNCVPKIIFLDIDGPMIPARAQFLPGNSPCKLGWTFDPTAVHMLNFLSWAVPDLQIVLSSHRWGDPLLMTPTGHSNTDREFWEQHFEEQGLNVRFHEDWITVRYGYRRPKVIEISEWLTLHPEVKTFVTLEDDFNGGDYVTPEMRRHFRILAESYDDGITWHDFKRMAFLLGVTDLRDKYAEFSTRNPVSV